MHATATTFLPNPRRTGPRLRVGDIALASVLESGKRLPGLFALVALSLFVSLSLFVALAAVAASVLTGNGNFLAGG